MKPAPLRLKKDQERRLLAGHAWIYSNEVDTAATPLKGLEPGQAVEVFSQRGRWLGHGYVNPHSLLCARLLSRDRAHPLGPSLLVQRIQAALGLRRRIYPQPFYRLVHGEGDGLPGLVVDRYGDLLAVQVTTAGMQRALPAVIAALEQVVRPQRIVLRNDTAVRAQEGLEQGIDWVLGEDPGEIELTEDGLRFGVAPGSGQKTGWFFDQADNRLALKRLAAPRRALDVCCYLGAWGLRAADAGAESVTFVDSSAAALDQVRANAARNGLEQRIQCRQGDAFETLRALREEEARFDLVILDPPAFIKRRKDEAEGTRAYQRLNRLGLALLEPGGMLVTASCSFHMERNVFLHTVQGAAQRTGHTLQLLLAGTQGPDHPVHPAIVETAYLKTFFLRSLPV
ncbi:class I SAM-dependent rRNA methyltransferase [Thiohalocapsa marina]|uniref:Class I SAM-dependent rRNA methyltransferase n=1 Tax=Thiohalocapsa marina TaxID=424902 RepID=A0A5M8FNV1_9GAMM|nr:class I SAM-dependent rRNA methyltransferase [Thiohalocapsa marina]KAA6186603.1 class I SAM-dependent rRNA methyltransferase [Thiohalocapsa marina]